MIPVIAIVRVRHPKGDFQLWAPLFLAWLLLAPLVVLLAPFAVLVWAAMGVNPARATGTLAAALCGLSGLLVEVESPRAKVLVLIR